MHQIQKSRSKIFKNSRNQMRLLMPKRSTSKIRHVDASRMLFYVETTGDKVKNLLTAVGLDEIRPETRDEISK